jgi:soluble lytic murein transglycosylase
MKRIGAKSLLLLFSLACLAPCLAEAKSHSKSHSAPPQLPNRNPHRAAQTAEPQAAPLQATSAPDTTAPATNTTTAAAIPLPDHNPKALSEVEKSAAPAQEAAALAQEAADVPLPDSNPKRGEPMSPPAPKPAMDYASILEPVLSYDLGSPDETYLRSIIHSKDKDNIDGTAAKISDPAARAFALWYRYLHTKSTLLNPEAVEQFRLAHPNWPGQDELREKAETALFLTNTSPDEIKAFFAASTPQTGAGKAALASVYLKDGNKQAAQNLVFSAWRDHRLNEDVEKKILDKFGNMLTPEIDRARIDRLLYPDDKSATDAALRVAKLLPKEEQKKVEARIAIVKRRSDAGKLLDALPDDAIEADLGLRFNNIQWLRRKDHEEEAWKMLLDTPSEPNLLLDLNNWWIERRVNCRDALNAGKPQIAYEIADKHGLVSGDSYIEAEFLAGWIALRFLSEPRTALRHFIALRQAATSSRNIALGEYWLGRTALALGDRGSAAVHFHGAAKYPQYFYGQLGRQALDPRPARLEVTPTPLPTQPDIDRFLSRDTVRAIGVARAAGFEWVTPQFFLALSRKLNNPAEVVLLAELAKAMDMQQVALRLSKIAFNRDLPLGDYALPVGVMPAFKSLLSERLDPALVHALSRQESEFNAHAKSPVGAAGLMQLMPSTARAIARQYKVKYSPSQLTDPAYNTQLGEAFLNDLIDNYGGSYFLALVAYNAGPGRVKEWIKTFGDPRNPDVDPVDWIERIPFTETRGYVVKIMETLQLYRSRLSGPQHALQLVQDLNRGRSVPPSETASIDMPLPARSP